MSKHHHLGKYEQAKLKDLQDKIRDNERQIENLNDGIQSMRQKIEEFREGKHKAIHAIKEEHRGAAVEILIKLHDKGKYGRTVLQSELDLTYSFGYAVFDELADRGFVAVEVGYCGTDWKTCKITELGKKLLKEEVSWF